MEIDLKNKETTIGYTNAYGISTHSELKEQGDKKKI